MNAFAAVFITVVLAGALGFLFFGNVLIGRFRTIQHLEAAKKSLAPVETSKAISKKQRLPVIGRRLLVDIASIPKGDPAEPFIHRTLTDVLQILHFRRHSLKKIIHELHLYCGLLLVAAIAATGIVAYEVNFDAAKIVEKATSQPFKVLALFELLMLGLFSLRLFIEIQIINDLLDD